VNTELEGNPAPPVVLTIAGFDPSSGAGITADLKVFAAHGLYGVSAITALTVQSTQGVRGLEPTRPEILAATLSCLGDDLRIEGVKIGMLATAGNVAVVSGFLEGSGIPRQRVVLDPVIRSSSGKDLLDSVGINRLRGGLLNMVGWITPNIEELAALIAAPIPNAENLPHAAAELQARSSGLNVVVTGGESDPPNDFLRTTGGAEHWFAGERIETTATHGTGCAFSSALLAALVRGKSDAEAVRAAKEYVSAAMRAAYRIGKGKGPVHHLFRQERDA